MDEEKKEDTVSETEEQDEETVEETEQEISNKKIKNLISAVILLSGLFVGSLFVDVAQMIKGGGFSQHALDSTDVFASNGKTWVAYSQPLVKLQVITDDSCGDACKPDEVLVGLKQNLPTLLNEKIDVNSPQGKKLVAQFNIKTIPAFIFSKEIEQTDLFAKAEPFLDKQGDSYAIKSAEAGFPVGEYLAAPSIGDKDIKNGSDEAAVKVIEFSDFANPADAKMYQTVVTPMMKDYGDKIQFVFKNYYPQGSAPSITAAMAGACANEQGKFLAFADKLFSTQATWTKQKDASATFSGYAGQLGLKVADFTQCLTGKKYQDQISQSLADGQAFGIAGTPATFVGTQLQDGVVSYDAMKKLIDDQLNK